MEGLTDATADGLVEGNRFGFLLFVDDIDGLTEGFFDIVNDGSMVGLFVGIDDGSIDGWVGSVEGTGVGSEDGRSDGLDDT